MRITRKRTGPYVPWFFYKRKCEISTPDINDVYLPYVPSAHIFVALALELESPSDTLRQRQNEPFISNFTDRGSKREEIIYDRLVETCSQHIDEHMRVLRLWSPDFISLATPLVTCALIGPAAMHAAKKPSDGDNNPSDVLHYLRWQFLEHTLRRFEQYWGLGTSMKGTYIIKCISGIHW